MEEVLSFDFHVETLGRYHDRRAFFCGESALDNYFHKQAFQDVKKKVAAVFVLVENLHVERVAGFYTLSSLSVRCSELPAETTKKLPKYPDLPATLLGRLAVSDKHRGRGLGSFLLVDALKRSFDQTQQIASVAVIVDAKNEAALSFYRKFDFVPFPNHPNRLFLMMGTIQKLFSS